MKIETIIPPQFKKEEFEILDTFKDWAHVPLVSISLFELVISLIWGYGMKFFFNAANTF